MTGGLIQIVAYGAQDLFLTSIPEITFFKYIYNRYTNFSMEFIELPLNGDKNFGQDIYCTIPRDGDLLNEIIVKVQLPRVELKRNDLEDNINFYNSKMIETEDIYINFKNYIYYIYQCILIINKGLKNINETFTNIEIEINEYLNSQKNYILTKSKISIDISNFFNIINDLSIISVKLINETLKKAQLKILIDTYLYLIKNISKKLFDNYLENSTLYENASNENYIFSWNRKIGFNIITSTELEIGGNIIDRQYNLWLYFWNQLFETNAKKFDLQKLHSLSSTCYNHDSSIKPSFDLYIPLKFFFCRNIGLSLPLISIRSQTINLKLSINNLKNVIHTTYPNKDIDNKIKINNITLLCKFIYLDQDERQKFANIPHEYVYEKINQLNYSILKNNEININLDFNYPSKYLIWGIQKKSDIENYNLDFNFEATLDYSVIDNKPVININKNNPVKSTTLLLNGSTRFNLDGNYYNYLTPYEINLSTPADGINFLPFCIIPKSYQPSGSCNFSQINSKKLDIFLNEEFLSRLSDNDYINVNIISVNHNVLTFKNGLCSSLFNF